MRPQLQGLLRRRMATASSSIGTRFARRQVACAILSGQKILHIGFANLSIQYKGFSRPHTFNPMAIPHALILRAPGANCDTEAEFAFRQAGALAERVHINRLREEPRLLHRYQILCLPGGFTYGDDVAAGKILANQLVHFLGDNIRRFRDADKLILGVCNGFQALLKAGIIIPPDEDGPLATLTYNRSGKFEDRWVHLRTISKLSPFLTGIEHMDLPVAHGEGRLIFREPWIKKGIQQSGQSVLRYASADQAAAAEVPYPENPNGSEGNIAGLCDASGRVLGLMPHPERHVLSTQHPQWTRRGMSAQPHGLQLFQNAVQYFSQN
jgi:phosphoribosylformylglycinamidine synthase I